MPVYEYQCDSCGEVFEVLGKFSDEPLTTHEKCGGPLRRVLSAPALKFKGTGWYVTDYAKGGASGSSPSNGGGKDGAKSESGDKSDSTAKSGASPAPVPSSSSSKSTDKSS